jgi:hypothetical protein
MPRFAQDRHKPPGDWVQTTTTLGVVGVQFRKREAKRFARAAGKAERCALRYSVRLAPQPDNPADHNAIAVYGVAESRGWFRSGLREWHVGYIDRETAAELTRDLIAKNVPIAAELYSIYEGRDGFLDFKIIVLAPPGHGMKVRLRGHS